MPIYAKVFQDEVRRLARKEAKALVGKLQQDNAAAKHSIADLKRRVTALERANKRLKKVADAQREEIAQEAVQKADRARISGKTIRTLRTKLSLTQAEFAKLLNVSPQSVYQWERRDDRLQLRAVTKEAVVKAKTLGAREARDLLNKA